MIAQIAQIAQQILPSQVPYSFLDYGVTAMVLIVLGIVLWFTFKVQRTIMADQNEVLSKLVENIQLIKEELLHLNLDTRYLTDLLNTDQLSRKMDQNKELSKEMEAISRRHEEKLHREEQSRHVKGKDEV